MPEIPVVLGSRLRDDRPACADLPARFPPAPVTSPARQCFSTTGLQPGQGTCDFWIAAGHAVHKPQTLIPTHLGIRAFLPFLLVGLGMTAKTQFTAYLSPKMLPRSRVRTQRPLHPQPCGGEGGTAESKITVSSTNMSTTDEQVMCRSWTAFDQQRLQALWFLGTIHRRHTSGVDLHACPGEALWLAHERLEPFPLLSSRQQSCRRQAVRLELPLLSGNLGCDSFDMTRLACALSRRPFAQRRESVVVIAVAVARKWRPEETLDERKHPHPSLFFPAVPHLRRCGGGLLQPNPPRGAALAAATQGGTPRCGVRPLVLAAESVAMQPTTKQERTEMRRPCQTVEGNSVRIRSKQQCPGRFSAPPQSQKTFPKTMPGSAASALELVGNLLPRIDKREMIDGRTPRTDLGPAN